MTSYPISSAEGENGFSQAYDQYERLVGKLNHEQAQTLTHGAVEALIHTEGMELLRRLTQGYLDKRSDEKVVKDQEVGADGVTRTHRRKGGERRLETRFGEIVVKRWGYGGRGLASVFPLDSALNLPPDKYSHGLRIELAHEVIHRSFDDAVSHLECLEGGYMAKRQTEAVAVKLSQDFDAYYEQPLTVSVTNAATENMLVIATDGKGIVMHPAGLREATRKASEKAASKLQTRP